MDTTEAAGNPLLQRVVDDLKASAGGRLRSVLLYGSAARGDYEKATSDLNLVVVLETLDLPTLESVSGPLRRWERKKQPLPRIFSPAMITESVDVFPIEFLDLKAHAVLLYGEDVFRDLTVRADHLRLQCERELREKMMRLREGYVEACDATRRLRQLLTLSFSTFVALFRGCLHLNKDNVPAHNEEVVAMFCARAELDPSPFDEVARLRHGKTGDVDVRALFARYYAELEKAVHRVNRFDGTL